MLLIRSQVLCVSKIRNRKGYEQVANQRWEWILGFGEEELMRSDKGKTKDRKLGQCWSLESWVCMQK